MNYTTYILHSAKLDKYYIGHTNDMSRRFGEHNRVKGKFTDSGIPWVVVYTEEYPTKSEALSRELEIKKKKSRKYIEWLIETKQ